jgi:HEAT repeat protein
MTFFTGFGEKIAISLTMDLLKASAAVVRRRLGKSDAEKALQAAIAQALDEALTSFDLPPSDRDHYGHIFEAFFRREAVVAELAQILDPRPGVELDFGGLAKELKEVGCDPDTISPFRLEDFLRTFASAFYGAAASQEVLRGNLEMKMLGEMVSRMGLAVQANERAATAVEQMAEGQNRIVTLLERVLAGQGSEPALLEAGREARNQGLLAALQAYELITSEMKKAGYDFGIGQTGAIEISGSLKVLPPAQEQIIRTLAADLRRTVLNVTPGPADLDALEARYRQHIIRWFENLQFQGLMRTPRPILLPLEEVYVELRAVAEVPDRADAFSVEERRLLLELDDKDEVGRRELMSQLDALRHERWSRTLPERKSLTEALHERDRRAFVILGDPGSGKSTFLHFLTLVYARGPATTVERLKVDPTEADRLPIFASLAAFDDMLRQSPGLTLAEFLARYYDRRRGLPGLDTLFQHALQSGRAIVLLDGLDEVLDSGSRGYVAQQVGALISEWSPRGVRFAISSRFVGYNEAPVPGNLPILSILDFGPTEIEVFVHRWAHAYEKWAANGVDSLEILHSARSLQSELLIDVRSNESVRRLAANPIMLTMLALLRHQVGKLPHRRVQLYESYIGTLLESWIDARSQGERERSVEVIDRHEAERLLMPLALWLQQETPSGTASRSRMQRKLAQVILEDSGLTQGKANRSQTREAEEKSIKFLREMQEKAGILVERGHNVLGFLHLTVQEYFAGQALARMPSSSRWNLLRYFLHDPHWLEPILLCAATLWLESHDKSLDQLIISIMEADDPDEAVLHRNLFLTLTIACEDLDLNSDLLRGLINHCTKLLPFATYGSIRRLAECMGRLAAIGISEAKECLDSALTLADDRSREVVVEALSRLPWGEIVRNILLGQLNDSSHRVREISLKALKGRVAGDIVIRDAVIETLRMENLRQNGGYIPVSLAASDDLADLFDDETAFEALLAVLQEGDFRLLHERVLSKILAIEGVVPRIRSTILRKLYHPYGDCMVTLPAARFFLVEDNALRLAFLQCSDLAPNMTFAFFLHEEIKSAICFSRDLEREMIGRLNSRNPEIRRLAIRALAPLVRADEQVRRALIEKLEDVEVRAEALRSLAPLIDVVEEVREFSLLMLDDESVGHRIAALSVISTVIGADRGLLGVVIERLLGGHHSERVAAFRCLFEAGALDMKIAGPAREAICFLDSRERQEVAQIFGGANYLNLAHLEVLAGILQERRSAEAGQSLVINALTLIRSNVKDARWRAFCLGKMDDANDAVRRSAVVSLSSLVDEDEEVCRRIIEALRDKSNVVRALAVTALSPLLPTNNNVREAILRTLKDQHLFLNDSLAIALSGWPNRDEDISRTAQELLHNENPNIRATATLLLAPSVYGVSLREWRVDLRQLAILTLRGFRGNNGAPTRMVVDYLEREFGRRGSLPPWRAPRRHATEHGGEEAYHSLLRQARNEDPHARKAAILGLGKTLRLDRMGEQTLIDGLGDAAFCVRMAAAEQIALADPEGFSTNCWTELRSWISAEVDPYIKFSDIVPWWRISWQIGFSFLLGGRVTEVENLDSWLMNGLRAPRWSTRLGAAVALLASPLVAEPDVVAEVILALDDSQGLESYEAQLSAAPFLINREPYTNHCVALSIEALSYGTQTWEWLPNGGRIRRQAAVILGGLEPLKYLPDANEKLLDVLRRDIDPEVRDAAYTALVRLAGARDRSAVPAT